MTEAPDPDITAMPQTEVNRISRMTLMRLHVFGEIAVDLAENKRRLGPGEACGFYGQHLTGAELLPADLRQVEIDIVCGEMIGRLSAAMDASWTIDRLWETCRAAAAYAIARAHGDAPAHDQALTDLAAAGLVVTDMLAPVPGALGGPLAWDQTFFEIDTTGTRLTAALALI